MKNKDTYDLVFYKNNKKLPKNIINVLKSYNTNNNEDKKIINKIIYRINDSSFITQQEINWILLNPIKKWVDYLIYRFKFKNICHDSHPINFPIYLLIELVSYCNLKCKICWHSNKNIKLDKGVMNFHLFKQIIDEASSSGTKTITMSSRGEPTLHPKFKEILQYCSNKFLEIKINTNVTTMDEELIRNILDNNIDLIVCSIDSISKNNYIEIRGKNIFNKIIRSIEMFNKIKSKYYKGSKTQLRIHGVKFNNNFNNKDFFNFWRKYSDNISISRYHERKDIYNNNISNNNPCDFLFDRMYVWFNGVCNPCDFDFNSQLSIGKLNYKVNNIKEIWNGKEYRKLRRLHLDKKRFCLEPCKRCDL